MDLTSFIRVLFCLLMLSGLACLVFMGVVKKWKISMIGGAVSGLVFIILIVLIAVSVILNFRVKTIGKIVDVEYSTKHVAVVSPEDIYNENGLTIIEKNGRVIGVYPESLVQTFVDIKDESTKQVNVSVQYAVAKKGVKMLGVWFTNENDPITAAVIFD